MVDDDLLLDLAIAPDDAIYAAVQIGLLRSDDDGRTWRVCFQAEGVPVTAVAVADDGAVLAAVPGGIGRSTDRGETWAFVQLPEPAPMIASLSSAAGAAIAGTMQDGVFVSTDGGETWTARNAGLLDHDIRAVASIRDVLYAATSTGLFTSANNGLRWRPAGDLPELAPLSALRALPTGALIAAVEGLGLWRSAGGSSWNRLDSPPDVDLLLVHSASGRLALLSDGAAFRSGDAGSSWTPAASLIEALLG
jgi:photosystem II stability/assembly factor-like uncharacterized protein